jgi:hypothetical protein
MTDKRACPACEAEYDGDSTAFAPGAILCTSCVDKEHELRTVVKNEIVASHEEIIEKAMAKRDEQVIEMINKLVNAPAKVEKGAPNIIQLWEDVARAWGGTEGVAAEALILYRSAKPTTQQKLLQMVIGLGVKANESGHLNKPTHEMTTAQLKSTLLQLIDEEQQKADIKEGLLALEEAANVQ